MLTGPRMVTFTKKTFMGKSMPMSMADNKTGLLWRIFMPTKRCLDAVDHLLYSIEVYDGLRSLKNFNEHTTFVKWAAVEVGQSHYESIEFDKLVIRAGLYAVFDYKGNVKDGVYAYGQIMKEWLPSSEYRLDNRPHFAVMGEKYNKTNHSEEEIWIPVKLKKKRKPKLP